MTTALLIIIVILVSSGSRIIQRRRFEKLVRPHLEALEIASKRNAGLKITPR